jgi:hypothetical protein
MPAITAIRKTAIKFLPHAVIPAKAGVFLWLDTLTATADLCLEKPRFPPE